jgi:hypothetical protein
LSSATLCRLALGVAAMALAACQRDDSVLLVAVSGDLGVMPAQLSVTVTAGGRMPPAFAVPRDPTSISLPTSFTVELDRSITGPVTVAIDALDTNGYVVASGATMQGHINSGGETIIAVMLESGEQP